MEAIEDAGSDSVCLAVAPGTTFAEFAASLAAIRRQFPALRVQGPSGGVILRLADQAAFSAGEAVARLRDAGLSSFAGDDLGSGGDSERVLELHRVAHGAGIRTAAGMVFGAGESLEDRVEHLFATRAIQEETGGFTAFTPWSFMPAAGAIEAPTAVEYMRTLAVSRMVLDNIENVESNCLAQGLKVVQMALRFGANDAGAIRAEGMKSFTEEDLRRVIRDAGFTPVERDTLYRTMFLNN
jgi:cyclic dehypoxanthinyl futalosine synthase